MNIAIAQLDYIIGDFKGNTVKIIKRILEAKNKGADIICFSELAICGYPPRDFLEFSDFLEHVQESLNEILLHTDGIAVIIGAPIINPLIEGKDLFNAALVLLDRKIVFEYHKTLLPTYDIFDEYRYFEPGSTFEVFHFRGYKIAITVCEDIWNISNENPLYTVCPMDELMHHQPDFAINISASPFSFEHAITRKKIVQANANRYQIPFFYIN
jgi:NAD+ synthase (glutamine-hydrolysing)